MRGWSQSSSSRPTHTSHPTLFHPRSPPHPHFTRSWFLCLETPRSSRPQLSYPHRGFSKQSFISSPPQSSQSIPRTHSCRASCLVPTTLRRPYTPLPLSPSMALPNGEAVCQMSSLFDMKTRPLGPTTSSSHPRMDLQIHLRRVPRRVSQTSM